MKRFLQWAALGAAVTLLSTAPVASAFTADPIVAAWLPAWAGQEALDSMDAHIGEIDEVLFFWYALSDEGTLTMDNGASTAIVRGVQAKGARAFMTVRNGFLPKRFHDMVSDPAKRAKHIADLILKMETVDFDGIDLDYEGLYLEDKDAYTQFVRDLAHEVHVRNKLISVAIQPKTFEPGLYNSTKAQEWKPVGAVVDRFRVMTYDKAYSGSAPGAVAPLPWMQDVMAFGATQVDPAKLHVGLPFYGYVWPEGQNGSSLTWIRAQELIQQYGVPVVYKDVETSSTFSYQKDVPDPANPGATIKQWHHVWFEDARSIQDKINGLANMEVGGASIWRLGKEDPGIWPALAAIGPRTGVVRFSDVPDGSLAATEIESLHARGVVSGEGGEFHPQRDVSRAETVKIALGHLRLPPIATDPQSQDVELASWAAPFIATAKERQIISGYEDGSFRPWAPITRAEALKIVLRARNIPAGGSARLPADVPPDAWYADLLRAALDRGIVRGDENGNFRPNDSISRAELVAILTR